MTKIMTKTISLISLCAPVLLSLLTGSNSVAAVAANAQAQCSGDMVVRGISCMSLGTSTDVRLYITEFQTCSAGQITELDRSIQGLYETEFNNPYSSVSIDEPAITIDYFPTRMTFPDRADDLTVQLPEAATLKGENGLTFKMSMTTNLVPDYDGAMESEKHFEGTYEKIDAQGNTVDSGILGCFVNN